MANFKRGDGSKSASTFKKGVAKKRSSPSDDETPRANKKSKGDDDEETAQVVPKLGKDDDGNTYISLTSNGKRRVTISEYNKSMLVSIREYYTNDAGEYKPAKKGISLTIEQYNVLLVAAPLLESVLAKRSIVVERPNYEASSAALADEDDAKVKENEDIDGSQDDEEDD